MSRILILEDEYFIAADCVSEAEKRGWRAVAVGNLGDALQLAQTAELDGALVDLDLHSKTAFSVVELLRRQMIPVVFYTGYSQAVLPEQLSSVPLFQKPSLLTEALDKLASLMKTAASREPDTTVDFIDPDHQARALSWTSPG